MAMRGLKWMRENETLTTLDKAKILYKVEECRDSFPEYANTVGVRPPSYTGEPHPIAVVDYGPGGCKMYCAVYR